MHIKNIDAELMSKFKAWCALNNVTMKQAIEELMRYRVEREDFSSQLKQFKTEL